MCESERRSVRGGDAVAAGTLRRVRTSTGRSEGRGGAMPMMIYRRSDKPEDLHPRTELAGKFLKKDENVAWKMADIQVPPPIPDDTAVPNVLRDERGLLRKDFLPAWHLKLEKQDLGMNMAARRLQASWRGFITRKRMVVSRETMKTVELRYLHRKVHQLQHERREQAAARESWLAAEAAKRPNPSVEELRSGRLRCMSSQVELGTLSTSSFISYSNQPGFDPTALGASTELFAAQRRPKRSADLDPRRAFIHQLERPRSPDAGRVITNNSGGMMSESMVWQPRKVGARPKTAPLNEGLTLLGARPATSGSSANGGMLGTGKLPPYKRRKKRKPRTAPADLTRTASIKSLGPDANESMSDEMLRQMRFDRMVEPIRPAVPGVSLRASFVCKKHVLTSSTAVAVGYHSERTRQVARKDPRKIGANTLMEVFMSADADKSGELDTSELRQCLVDLELGLNEDELDRLVQDCDSECEANSSSMSSTCPQYALA